MADQVSDKVFRIGLPIPFPLKTVNVFFIADRPGTLIDTGLQTDASFEALKEGMKAIGFTLRSIERILITHGHIDHYGQAKKLSSLLGVPIYIHPREYGRIRSILHALGPLKSLLLRNGAPERLADETLRYFEAARGMAQPLEEAFFLNDGDAIAFESTALKTMECPGHSPGMLCFHWPEKKILFTGDHLLKEITPNPVLDFMAPQSLSGYSSLKEYLISLEKVRRLDLSLLLPGHGEAIEDSEGLIRKIFAHHKQRTELVRTMLLKGEKTAFDLAMNLFGELRAFEVFLGISEVVGHLEILKEKGEVRVRTKDGRDYYSSEM